MTTTHSTATAAHLAGVTVPTIRTWIHTGAVSATKTSGRWAITEESLLARIAIADDMTAARNTRRAAHIAKHADLTPYKDQIRAAEKVVQLIEDGALVPTGRSGQYLTVSSKGDDKYLTDTHLLTCTCRSFVNRTYCTHMTAAQAIEAARPTRRPTLTLAA